MAKYIYEYENWPNFTWDYQAIQVLLGDVRQLQGRVLGQMQALGFSTKAETTLAMLTLDVVKTSEIEGEMLNYEQVRSSIARRLGIEIGGLIAADRHVEGVVDMILDATQRSQAAVTEERLFGWHAALFPTGYSGMHRIEVGRYRTGEMQVVSGAMGKEKVHYEAVPAKLVKGEMDRFLRWINQDTGTDLLLKAAIAHFWFIIIHPFDDGNGRIARAISDLLLARADGQTDRFYSMSSQILMDKKGYYAILQKVQHSSGDISEWLVWFLTCLQQAFMATQNTLHSILRKARFWALHEHIALNERQRLMLNKLLDGLNSKLKTSKWASMTKSSPDTALRDIKDLMEKGILRQEVGGGRSTNYELVFD